MSEQWSSLKKEETAMNPSGLFTWAQAIGISFISLVILSLGSLGVGLWLLVKTKSMHPSSAQTTIQVVGGFVGWFFGTIGGLVLIAMISPDAARWIINRGLTTLNTWQNNVQIWLDSVISDSATASVIGLIFSKIQFGLIMILYPVGKSIGWCSKHLMGKAFHNRTIRGMLEKEVVLPPPPRTLAGWRAERAPGPGTSSPPQWRTPDNKK